MPQMAPISWLILFLLFSFIFIIFNMMNYYCFFMTNQKIKNLLNKNKNFMTLNWKW